MEESFYLLIFESVTTNESVVDTFTFSNQCGSVCILDALPCRPQKLSKQTLLRSCNMYHKVHQRVMCTFCKHTNVRKH